MPHRLRRPDRNALISRHGVSGADSEDKRSSAHLDAVINAKVLGQVGVHFRVSIRADSSLSQGTSRPLEVAITFRKQHAIMWPHAERSAMLTGNASAFILRVPGTQARRLVEPERWVFVGTRGCP